MFQLIWIASTRIAVFLRTWMPSNILLDAIRTRRGLKWGIPAMSLAAIYFGLAYACTTLIDKGWPEWLYLFVLVFIWSGFKFLWIGPISVLYLTRARIREHSQQKKERRAAADEASSTKAAAKRPTNSSH